ncbi:MAG TPA: hypothetical protein PKK99_04940 [Bacteroidia bacterium]|nr:hypothetical protein [Bacteroidia bacterium]HNP98375.1 hypothetical protein [Bacteroidia bacterium]
MNNSKKINLLLVQSVLWGAIFFSSLALVYHIRWFIPFLMDNSSGVVPGQQMPFIWFVVQICNNIIFVFVSALLIRLVRKYQETGFFDSDSLQAFDGVIISCMLLALLSTVQIIANNYYEVHSDQWNSIIGISNLLFRSFTKLLIFQQPQTMYFLLAVILWAVKQFVTKALVIKSENESFV